MENVAYKVTTDEGTQIIEAASPWLAAKEAKGTALAVELSTVDGKTMRTTARYDNAVEEEGLDEDNTSRTFDGMPLRVWNKLLNITEGYADLEQSRTIYWPTAAGLCAQTFRTVKDDGDEYVDYDQPVAEPILIATLSDLVRAVQSHDRSRLESILYSGIDEQTA